MLGEKLFLILLPIFVWLLVFPVFIAKRAIKTVPLERRPTGRRRLWLTIIGSSVFTGLLFKLIYSQVIIPNSQPFLEGLLRSGFIIGAVIGLVYFQVSNDAES